MAYRLRLREIRKARGLTQTQLGDAIGLSKQTISGYETGVHDIFLDDACRICDVLGCTLDELAGRTPPAMAPDEAALLDAYRQCDPIVRHAVMGAVQAGRGAGAVPLEATGAVI